MRLIEVLPDYEAKRFSRPPVMTSDDRKKYFKIDDSIRASIEKTKQPDNKVGLLVQYGYFKLCGKFFTTKIFKPADIKAASKKLGITASNDFVEKYKDRTRQKHRVKILEVCGYVDFDSAIATFEEAVADMVDKQMHPRKLFYVTFAPRIKDLSSQNLVSFARIKSELEHKEYPITPTYYVNESKITRNWDNILRLIATIKLREHRALTIIKRLGDYSSQHPLQEALKEFGRIIKSIFILK